MNRFNIIIGNLFLKKSRFLAKRQTLNERGIVLLIVLVVLLVVIALAVGMLNIMSNQSRITHHKVSRIQAYYAALAGANLAFQQLRTRVWNANSCPNNNPCLYPDPAFPNSIVNRQVSIIFCPSGNICSGSLTPCNPPPNIGFCIQTTANYTYTP